MQSATQFKSQSKTESTSVLSQSRRIVAATTLTVGLGLVFLTGFANSAAVHNAAHDTRHAMAFPCH